MIQVALFRGKSLVSKLIRWQTRSVYSHAAFYFPEDVPVPGRVRERLGLDVIPARYVAEAWHIGGTRLGPIDETHTPGTEVDLFDVWNPRQGAYQPVQIWPMQQGDPGTRLLDRIGMQLGTPYDWRGVFRFVSRRHAFESNRLFCSSMVTVDLGLIGRPPLLRIPPSEVSPRDLGISSELRLVGQIVTVGV